MAVVGSLTTWSPGDVIPSGTMNSNFAALKTSINTALFTDTAGTSTVKHTYSAQNPLAFSHGDWVDGALAYTSSDNLTALAIGSANDVLTTDGSTPGWTSGLVNAHISASAAIVASKIAAGTFGAGTYSFAGSTISAATSITSTAFVGAINGTVGASTPASGAFTTITASSTLAVTGTSTFTADATFNGGFAAVHLLETTGATAVHVDSDGGYVVMGASSSAGGGLITGLNAYAGVLATLNTTDLVLGTNSAANLTITSGGAIAMSSTLNVTGAITGNVTGNCSGSSGSTTGNAATATALETARTIGGTSFDGTANISVALATDATTLATPRNINGVSFDGSANITVTAAAGTLTGTTLKSTVVTSSLTSLGTIATLEGGTGHFTGNVGIGQAVSGTFALAVTETGDDVYAVSITHSHVSGARGIFIDYSNDTPIGTGNLFVNCIDGSATRIELRSNGGIANFSANNVNLASDDAIKTRRGALPSTWDFVEALDIFNYNYNEDLGGRIIAGMSANQIGKLAPNLRAAGDTDGYYEHDLSMYVSRTVQECQARIKDLEAEVAVLKA